MFYGLAQKFIAQEGTVIRPMLFLVVTFLILNFTNSSFVKADPVGEPPAPVSDETGSQNQALPSSNPNVSAQVAELHMNSEPPAPAAVIPPAQGKQIIASTEGDWPDVTVDITELKRTGGDTLTLKFTMSNGSSKNIDFNYNFGDGTNDFNTIGATHLLDVTNKKKYFVVRDSNGKCTCSYDQSSLTPGAKRNLWAKFPAPPANVSKITVAIPHFIPVDDVPIS